MADTVAGLATPHPRNEDGDHAGREGTGMEINGIAHICVAACNFETSRAFYVELLPFLGLKIVSDTPRIFYGVGGRTGFGIEAPPEPERGKRFVQGTVGLHHVCFRARERADV